MLLAGWLFCVRMRVAHRVPCAVRRRYMPSVVRTFFGVKGTRGDANGVKAAVWRWVAAAHPCLEWRRTRTGTLHKSVFDEVDAVLVATYHVAAQYTYDVLQRLALPQPVDEDQPSRVRLSALGRFCPDELVATFVDAYAESKRVRKGADKAHLRTLVRACLCDHAVASRPAVPGTGSLAGAGDAPPQVETSGPVAAASEDRDWAVAKRIAKQLRNDVETCVAALLADPEILLNPDTGWRCEQRAAARLAAQT